MKKYLFIVAFTLAVLDSFAQPTWQRTYGTIYNDRAEEMVETSDGGYILVGTTGYDLANNKISCHIVKTNSDGDSIWTKTYQIPVDQNITTGFTICQSYDEGYVVGGATDKVDSILGNSNSFLMKLNSQGDSLWSKIFQAPGSNSVIQVITIPDTTYIVRGDLFTSSGIIAKVNDSFDTLWTIDTLFGIDIDNTGDGNYILFNTNRRLVKISDSGGIIWNKGYNFSSTPRRVITLMDGNMLAMGGTQSTVLLKVNPSGDSLWSNVITDSGSPLPIDIIQTSDGGFMVTGVVSGLLFDTDIYLLKLDQNGQKEWSTAFFRAGLDEWPVNIGQQSDGGYVIFGWGEDGSIGEDDWLFVKTDSMGVITGLWEEVPQMNVPFHVYPNPATDKVQFVANKIFTGTLQLFDITGKVVWESDFDKITGWVIPVTNLEEGLYLLEIFDALLKTRYTINIIKIA